MILNWMKLRQCLNCHTLTSNEPCAETQNNFSWVSSIVFAKIVLRTNYQKTALVLYCNITFLIPFYIVSGKISSIIISCQWLAKKEKVKVMQ